MGMLLREMPRRLQQGRRKKLQRLLQQRASGKAAKQSL
jgi:hypothetical protein